MQRRITNEDLFRRFETKRRRPAAVSWVIRRGETRSRAPNAGMYCPRASHSGQTRPLPRRQLRCIRRASTPPIDLNTIPSISQAIDFVRYSAIFRSPYCLISSTCETPDPRGIHRADPPPRLLVDGRGKAVGRFAIADLSDRRRCATSSALGLFPLGTASPTRNGPRRSTSLALASRVAPQALADSLQHTPAGCLSNYRRSRRCLGRARISRSPSSGTLRRNCSSRDPPRRAASHPAQIPGDGIRRGLSGFLSPTTRLFSFRHGPQLAPAQRGIRGLTAAMAAGQLSARRKREAGEGRGEQRAIRCVSTSSGRGRRAVPCGRTRSESTSHSRTRGNGGLWRCHRRYER